PISLSCEEADAFVAASNATYTNNETGNCEVSGSITAAISKNFNACSGGEITVAYTTTDACGNPLSQTHTITVNPANATTLSLPIDLPTSLSCEEADAFVAASNATYTNNETGNCEVSGSITRSEERSVGNGSGWEMTVAYTTTDACGNPLSQTHTITVNPANATTLSLPNDL